MIQMKLFAVLSSILLVSSTQLPFIVKDANPFASSLPTIADLLTVERTTTIMHSYLRESASLSPLLSSQQSRPILFLPQDSIITAMTRLPHQGPPPSDGIEIGISGTSQEEEELKDLYLQHFLSRHISILGGEWSGEGEASAQWESMYEGKKIEVAKIGEDWLINDKVKVVKVLEAVNGRVVIISGVLSMND